MTPIYQAGTRVHTPDATYTLPDEASARDVLVNFLKAQRSDDQAVATLRRYNAHLEALLAGAKYESTADALAAIDPRVLELPKKPTV